MAGWFETVSAVWNSGWQSFASIRATVTGKRRRTGFRAEDYWVEGGGVCPIAP